MGTCFSADQAQGATSKIRLRVGSTMEQVIKSHLFKDSNLNITTIELPFDEKDADFVG